MGEHCYRGDHYLMPHMQYDRLSQQRFTDSVGLSRYVNF